MEKSVTPITAKQLKEMLNEGTKNLKFFVRNSRAFFPYTGKEEAIDSLRDEINHLIDGLAGKRIQSSRELERFCLEVRSKVTTMGDRNEHAIWKIREPAMKYVDYYGRKLAALLAAGKTDDKVIS